jgi:hypothetical protein
MLTTFDRLGGESKVLQARSLVRMICLASETHQTGIDERGHHFQEVLHQRINTNPKIRQPF